MSRTFQCQECGKKVEVNSVACCAPDMLRKDKIIYCCGSPMMEIIED
ncbi:MAG: hypothetical protein ACE5J5_05670 [Candidatus Hydrothermarchaeales archaeon]